MIIVPFIPCHLDNFDLQEEQVFMSEYINDQYKEILVLGGPAFTGLIDGKPIVISGVLQADVHLGTAWLLLTKDARNHMLSVTRGVSNFLENTPIKRIQTAIRRDFKEGHRWAKILGFTNETPEMGMRGYGPDGQTHDLYARIK